jgi:glycosyltransferase involved in cell wall biosynthesis
MPADPSPLVSVVVPFFDSERHIAECIESLLAQQDVGGPYEIILIDNGSTDGSPSIVARYPDLVVLEETKPGAYAARNAGIRRARAPVIAFTDADCVVAADWLRAIRAGMEDRDVGVLLGHCAYPPAASLGLRLLGAYENSKARYVTERCPPAYHFAHANNMAVRAEVFAEQGLFKEWRRAADTELIQRLGRSRPDLRTRFLPTMKITHLEFVRTRSRMQRMRLYTQTNSRIDTFRELGLAQRLGVLGQLVRDLRA